MLTKKCEGRSHAVTYKGHDYVSGCYKIDENRTVLHNLSTCPKANPLTEPTLLCKCHSSQRRNHLDNQFQFLHKATDAHCCRRLLSNLDLALTYRAPPKSEWCGLLFAVVARDQGYVCWLVFSVCAASSSSIRAVVRTGQWEEYVRETWKTLVWEATSWKKSQSPAGAVFCEIRDLGITLPSWS